MSLTSMLSIQSMPWLPVGSLVLHVCLTLLVVARVLRRRAPIATSFAWFSLVFAMPVAGAILYFLLGERRTDPARRRFVRDAEVGVRGFQRALSRAEPAERLAPITRYVEAVAGFPPVGLPSQKVKLFYHYETVFADLVAHIDGAERSCHLSFYIWFDGGLADDVATSLVQAARRGVRCRVLVDALGSAAFLRGKTARALRDAGVEVVAALPLRLLRSRVDLRNHRKIVVIDGRVAYTGSQNLVDPRFFKQDAGVGEWVDALVRVEGPVVACLDAVFRRDWSIETRTPFEAPALPAAHQGAEARVVQALPSGPEVGGPTIEQVLLMTLYAATETVTITTPYFVPSDSLLEALVATSRRGVQVTLIVPEKNDSVLVTYASEDTFAALLAAGVVVARFRGGLLHTKSVVVDGRFCVFGSVNFDLRSLWLDAEISLLVHDVAFAEELTALHHRYLVACDRLDLQAWSARPATTILLERLGRLSSPLL